MCGAGKRRNGGEGKREGTGGFLFGYRGFGAAVGAHVATSPHVLIQRLSKVYKVCHLDTNGPTCYNGLHEVKLLSQEDASLNPGSDLLCQVLP